MTEWIYLFTYNPSFPPPKEEIATLAALDEKGCDVCLMLPDRDAPPMSGASPGERVHLCTRRAGSTQLEIRARATVAGRAFRAPTPVAVVGLYGQHEERTWLPLEVNTYFGSPLTTEEAGLDIDEEVFARGQAYVRRVRRRHRSEPPARAASHVSTAADRRATTPERTRAWNSRGVFLGIDLTAGSWESGMDQGDKPFPCARIDVGDDGQLHWVGIESFTSLSSLLAHQWMHDATVIAIDGPVRLCGGVLRIHRRPACSGGACGRDAARAG